MATTDTQAHTDGQPISEIQSLCLSCGSESGVTKLLLTSIPYFGSCVISSFSCPACGHSDNEVQSTGKISPLGKTVTLKVEDASDLQRSVIKTETATFRIEELDLTAPSNGKGRYTNVEGMVRSVADDLEMFQEQRRESLPEVAEKVAGVIERLRGLVQPEGTGCPFTVSVDDPAGNSWIEPRVGEGEGRLSQKEYTRSKEQNRLLGIGEGEERNFAGGGEYKAHDMVPEMPQREMRTVGGDDKGEEDIVENHVYTFPASCSACTRPCETNMKMVNIPHFKQVVLMSSVCEHCGYKSNEVKTGGEVPEKGKRIRLRVEKPEDLDRDILKGESATLICPELRLHVQPGTMGGRFTTVEGILTQMREDLSNQAFGGDKSTTDSMLTETKKSWDDFFAGLDEAVAGKRQFTLTLQDPLAGSYVQKLTDDKEDPQITVEDYERTQQEDEDLGLRDMKTEGYEA